MLKTRHPRMNSTRLAGQELKAMETVPIQA